MYDIEFLPISHLMPTHSCKQSHSYEPGVFLHVPPLKHGFCRHSLMSGNIREILDYV